MVQKTLVAVLGERPTQVATVPNYSAVGRLWMLLRGTFSANTWYSQLLYRNFQSLNKNVWLVGSRLLSLYLQAPQLMGHPVVNTLHASNNVNNFFLTRKPPRKLHVTFIYKRQNIRHSIRKFNQSIESINTFWENPPDIFIS